jgi:hypothetical protein
MNQFQNIQPDVVATTETCTLVPVAPQHQIMAAAATSVSIVPRSEETAGGLRIAALPGGGSLYATAEAAATYLAKVKTAGANRANDSDWQQFVIWCDENGLESYPDIPC